ncbi:hypothetical protein ACH41E_28565 [Streptomyces sp. NPDC020412]|uniref:hypothetical protein n=1 Tax=Streptomyces sp. NPDC020412 TaxID=3365073 RepID=UPI0037B0F02F
MNQPPAVAPRVRRRAREWCGTRGGALGLHAVLVLLVALFALAGTSVGAAGAQPLEATEVRAPMSAAGDAAGGGGSGGGTTGQAEEAYASAAPAARARAAVRPYGARSVNSFGQAPPVPSRLRPPPPLPDAPRCVVLRC